MLLLILSTQGRKWGFCTEIPVKSDWSELSVGILAAPVFVKAIRQGFFSFLCERFNEAADIHFSQSDFISFSSKAAQSKSYHQTFSPSHCSHCHWFVPTFCSLLPALPQTCNHQTVQILTRKKKKIAQLKNTRENENSSYSVDLYTLCITLKMFKREPTSYFPVFGDTKIQTHVLASFCTRIAQLQDRKRIANRSDYRTKSQESMSINIVIRFSCVNLLIWMPLHSLSVWRQAELPTLK